jgi:Fe-coproporphyrin III synthase
MYSNAETTHVKIYTKGAKEEGTDAAYLLDRDLLQAFPGRVFADKDQPDLASNQLANLVSPLVIEADGTVVPIQYGFARGYALGNLQQASLDKLAARWRRENYGAFRALCLRVFEEIIAPAQLPFVNWYDVIARMSRSPTGAPT